MDHIVTKRMATITTDHFKQLLNNSNIIRSKQEEKHIVCKKKTIYQIKRSLMWPLSRNVRYVTWVRLGSTEVNCRISPFPPLFQIHLPALIPRLVPDNCCILLCSLIPTSSVDNTDLLLQIPIPLLITLSQAQIPERIPWKPANCSGQEIDGLTAEDIFPFLFSSRFVLQQVTYYGLLCLFISIFRARNFLQNSSLLIQLFQPGSSPVSSRNSLGTYSSGLPEKQVSQPCKQQSWRSSISLPYSISYLPVLYLAL